jgi:hypothetical protein
MIILETSSVINSKLMRSKLNYTTKDLLVWTFKLRIMLEKFCVENFRNNLIRIHFLLLFCILKVLYKCTWIFHGSKLARNFNSESSKVSVSYGNLDCNRTVAPLIMHHWTTVTLSGPSIEQIWIELFLCYLLWILKSNTTMFR